MNSLNQVLREADARLTVPEPARSRILLELAADMEDLYQAYMERGADPADAEAAVLEHFDLSDETLTALVRIHDTPVQRALERVTAQVAGPWSRLLVVALSLFVVLGSGTLLLQSQVYQDASRLVWILMPLLGLGMVVAALQGHRIYRRETKMTLRLRVGSEKILGLAALVIVLTLSGVWVELFLTALRVRESPGQALVYLVHWLHQTSATLVIAVSGSLILGFLWFFLESRTRKREREASVELLGGEV